MDDELFTRDEILGGGLGRGRRARALLVLIEQEASRSADRARYASALASPEALAMADVIIKADPEVMRGPLPGESGAAYVESFRSLRRHAQAPDIREIERATDTWQVLLPEDIRLRAAVFHELAQRHELVRARTRKLCAAFGVDDPAFAAAYAKAAGRSLDETFVPDHGAGARMRRLFGRGR